MTYQEKITKADDLEARLKALEANIETLEAQIKVLDAQIALLRAQQHKTNDPSEIETLENRIKELWNQRRQTQSQTRHTLADIGDLRDQLDDVVHEIDAQERERMVRLQTQYQSPILAVTKFAARGAALTAGVHLPA